MNYRLIDVFDTGRLLAGVNEVRPAPLTYWQAHAAAKEMELSGGGFAAAIADAYFKADGDNAARLRAAFDPMFRQYMQQTEVTP